MYSNTVNTLYYYIYIYMYKYIRRLSVPSVLVDSGVEDHGLSRILFFNLGARVKGGSDSRSRSSSYSGT